MKGTRHEARGMRFKTEDPELERERLKVSSARCRVKICSRDRSSVAGLLELSMVSPELCLQNWELRIGGLGLALHESNFLFCQAIQFIHHLVNLPIRGLDLPLDRSFFIFNPLLLQLSMQV